MAPEWKKYTEVVKSPREFPDLFAALQLVVCPIFSEWMNEDFISGNMAHNTAKT